jgi:3-isopropylmalate/(R)-2-methylmalate dehydratase small subunit
MNEIKQVTGRGVPLLLDDIDTDRIIPARFLRCVTFEGLGEHAFADDRKQDSQHPFDNPQHKGGKVLISGRNFGCGSSREHAPQALMRWGIRAVVAESFAEIFFGNCTSLGIPCVSAQRADLERLASAVAADPRLEITVDLEQMEIRYGSERAAGTMPDSARQALTTGEYDFLGQLLEGEAQIRQTASHLPYLNAYGS